MREILEQVRELLIEIRTELSSRQRPAEEVILDDVDLRNMLKVSKRTTAYWRSGRLITFTKVGSKTYYKLSDVLKMLKDGQELRIEPRIGRRN
jgi:hypothetical protein